MTRSTAVSRPFSGGAAAGELAALHNPPIEQPAAFFAVKE
jgi:hypothetical protein